MKRKMKPHSKRRRGTLNAILIALLTYLLLFILLLTGVTPKQYDIQIGQPSAVMIKATKDIVDTVTTNANKEAAANAVEPSYKSVDHRITAALKESLHGVFEEIRTIRSERIDEEGGYSSVETAELAALNRRMDAKLVQPETEETAETDEKEEAPTEAGGEVFGNGPRLTPEGWESLLMLSDEAFAEIAEDAAESFAGLMDSTILEGQEKIALRTMAVTFDELYDSDLSAALTEIIRGTLRPNMLIDREITETNRQIARDSVPNVMRVKDELIVSEGERVTEAQYQMLASLGLLNDDDFDLQLIIGIALIVLLLLGSFACFLAYFYAEMLANTKKVLLLSLIMLITVGSCLLTSRIDGYLMPTALAVLLLEAFFGSRITLFGTTIIGLMSALLAPSGSNNLFVFAAMTAMSAPIVLFLYKYRMDRTTALLAGLLIAVLNFFTMVSFGLYNSADLGSVMRNAGMTACGGMLAAVLAIALQLFLEAVFNQATAAKLMEMSNPQQKLLRRLQIEAPGTYHHSIIVANLAEAACTAIGANALLARVGSYYHDIGKLVRPVYFAENQMGENPHDRLEAHISASMLTAHPRDGATLAEKERLPEAVIDIIRQHHGDGIVRYFYSKACEQSDQPVNMASFRYEGPRPQTREAAVVMLADSVEAATRSLKQHSRERVEEMIRKLINDKQMEGQLDSSKLSLTDIDSIIHAFSGILSGIYHERPEYPDAPASKPDEDVRPTVVEAPDPEETETPEPIAEEPEAEAGEEEKSEVKTVSARVHRPIVPGPAVPPHEVTEG